MSTPLYRERKAGPAPRVHDELPDHTKRGLIAVLAGALDSDQLAKVFPEQCNDGNGICGTNRSRATDLMEAFVADFNWPPREDIDDDVLFDLIEFFAARVEQPKQVHWHSYFSHYELEFDRRAGFIQFRDDVNAILSAGRTVYELSGVQVERVGTPEIQAALADLRPDSGDEGVDTLITDARQLYLSPKGADRQTGLEKLWDAFERLKTIEVGKDKKAQIAELLQHVISEPLRAEVEKEMRALTDIGNNFRIRHHETSKHPIPDSNASDYLFARLSNLIIFLLKASDRLES
ncbi:hypothetical protein [Planctomonas deserti]|uniref:hypothetical protein n=1 Tax=Planctomonas deserti TaxID=2144185 RepID=UPI00131EE184|nr:hypothetical protein [Planctomonas deserti]